MNLTVSKKIELFIENLPESHQVEIKTLHHLICEWLPNAKLWFETGINEVGKVVSNPNIGYGHLKIKSANGLVREFFQLSISPNSTGISVNIMGIRNKMDLSQLYSTKIGKAKVTGYCIKFKSLKDIKLDVLKEAILTSVKLTSPE